MELCLCCVLDLNILIDHNFKIQVPDIQMDGRKGQVLYFYHSEWHFTIRRQANMLRNIPSYRMKLLKLFLIYSYVCSHTLYHMGPGNINIMGCAKATTQTHTPS